MAKSIKEAREVRKALANKYRKNTKDSGRNGRIFELECASENSTKCRVSKQGQTDIFVKIGTANSHFAAECKTNGGRIGNLMETKAPKYVIYRMDIVFHHKAGKFTQAYDEHRVTEPLLIPTDLFLAKLVEFNAIKSTNGQNPEPAIQVSSKRFYEWLLDYPVVYDQNHIYKAWEFEDLT